jgi:hypothetical protein
MDYEDCRINGQLGIIVRGGPLRGTFYPPYPNENIFIATLISRKMKAAKQRHKSRKHVGPQADLLQVWRQVLWLSRGSVDCLPAGSAFCGHHGGAP